MQEEFEDTPWKGLSESICWKTDKAMAKRKSTKGHANAHI
jgi:hypothetical protein